MSHSEFERPFPVPKEFLDTVNSISWFLMDAFWMLQVKGMAYICLPPTLLTGLALLYIEKRKPIFFINIAINCWIWMNTLWMISDLQATPDYLVIARSLFALGMVFIIVAAGSSPSLKDTFSHFKRFRITRFK